MSLKRGRSLLSSTDILGNAVFNIASGQLVVFVPVSAMSQHVFSSPPSKSFRQQSHGLDAVDFPIAAGARSDSIARLLFLATGDDEVPTAR